MLVELLIHQGIFYEVILDFLPFFFFFFWVPKYESEFAKVNLAGCKGKKKKLILNALYLVK